MKGYEGEIDVVIDGVKGKQIKNGIKKFKSNIFIHSKSNMAYINDNEQFVVFAEVKMNYFNNQPINFNQLNNYKKLIKFLMSMDDNLCIKNKLNIKHGQKIIFLILTNGDYNHFSYDLLRSKSYQEDKKNETSDNICNNTTKIKFPGSEKK